MSLKPYAQGKSSRAEWISTIPSHWREVRLKFGLELITDKASDDSPKVALENIESWTGRYIETLTEFEGDGTSFQCGDVLFGKLRPYLAKALLADAPGQAVGDFHVLRPKDEVDGRFALSYLLSQDFIAVVDGSTYGAKMPRASWEFMSNLPLPLPPLSEQTAIAAFLDRETGKIDALVEEQRRLIELLKEKRQAVISNAVTKGLDPNARMKPSGVEWLGEVPEHWEVVPAKRVASVFVPQRNKPELNADGEGLPWVTMEMMTAAEIGTSDAFVSEAAALAAGSRVRPPNSVIASCVGTFGVAAINRSEVIINQQLQAYLPAMVIMPELLRFLVLAGGSYFDQVGTAATLAYVNQEGFANFPIAVPPRHEQARIVAELSSVLVGLDSLTAEALRGIALLNERRSALIAAAVTGKIDVREAAQADVEAA